MKTWKIRKRWPTKEIQFYAYIFLILGILLILGGVGYIIYKKQNAQPQRQGGFGGGYAQTPSQGGLTSFETEGMKGMTQMQQFERMSPQAQQAFEQKAKLLQQRRAAFRNKKEQQRLQVFKAFSGFEKPASQEEQKKFIEKKEKLEEVTTEGWIDLQELNQKLKISPGIKVEIKKEEKAEEKAKAKDIIKEEKAGEKVKTQESIGGSKAGKKEALKTISQEEFDRLSEFVEKRKKIQKEITTDKKLSAQDQEIFDKLSSFVEKKQEEIKGKGFKKEIVLTKEEERLIEELAAKSEDLFDLLPKPKREITGSEFDVLGNIGKKSAQDEEVYLELKKRIGKIGEEPNGEEFEKLEKMDKSKKENGKKSWISNEEPNGEEFENLENIKNVKGAKKTGQKKKKFEIPDELRNMADVEEKPKEKNNSKNNNQKKKENNKR